MIINHDHEEYRKIIAGTQSHYNGAFYYSKEICKFIIPNVTTDRNWVTIKAGNECLDHSIFFVHNNINSAERYDYLKNCHDLILVCGVPETCEKVKHLGTPIYLPLSVDVDYVSQFKQPKENMHGTCYVGRQAKMSYDGVQLPDNIDYITGLKRQELLPKMAQYEKVYAVGRTAIEAKILGCEVLPFDPRYPDPDIWQPLDNIEAARILQEKIDEIDLR